MAWDDKNLSSRITNGSISEIVPRASVERLGFSEVYEIVESKGWLRSTHHHSFLISSENGTYEEKPCRTEYGSCKAPSLAGLCNFLEDKKLYLAHSSLILPLKKAIWNYRPCFIIGSADLYIKKDGLDSFDFARARGVPDELPLELH